MIKKDEYIQRLHTKFDELNAEIDKLKVKVDAIKAEKIAEYQRQIEDLQGKRKASEIFRPSVHRTGAADNRAADRVFMVR